MPPSKATHHLCTGLQPRQTVSTRSRAIVSHPHKDAVARGKRKADCSPSKENKAVKRSAFGDINVNALALLKAENKKGLPPKKVKVQARLLPSVKTVLKPRQNENLAPPPAPAAKKVVTRATHKNVVVPDQTAQKPKEACREGTVQVKPHKRLSNEFDKTEETLYCTALEEAAKRHHTRSSKSPPTDSSPCSVSSMSMVARQMELKLNLGNHEVPLHIEDYDKENWNDIFQVSHYAMDIFNYLKDREATFHISDYMDRQICLTRWMRSLLVDWMVEIQESFELNHETLYLGVKLVDMYLSKMTVGRETLQLVGAAAMFIASKYDERIPPQISDFLYICDGAYTRRELIRMEMNLLKICDFDLGIPISYRFLRRYARCAKITMPVLTLARFILEFSLMDYTTITIRDSILASAALFLALRMKKVSSWTPTLEFYTGYKLDEVMPVVRLLNTGLHKPPKSQIMTVRNKYSHKIFFEVAKTPLLKDEDL